MASGDTEKNLAQADGSALPIVGGPPSTGRPAGSIIAAVLLLSVVTGFIASQVLFSSIFYLAVLVSAVWACFRWPRAGLIVFLFYTSTILAPEFFGLWVDTNLVYQGAEIFMLILIAAAIRARNKEGPGAFQQFFSSPVSFALMVLIAVIIAKSLVFAIEFRFAQSALSHVYTFNRSIGFFAMFIPVFLLFNTVSRQRFFLTFILVMGCFISIRVLLEAIFPSAGIFDYISLSGQLFEEFPSVDPLVQRLRAPGGSLVQICFWTGLMNLILRPWTPKRLAIFLPLTLLTLASILLEFNRSYVIPIILLSGLAFLLNRKAVRLKLVSLLAVVFVIFVLISAATGSLGIYTSAFLERYGSAFSSETFEAQTITSRNIENEYAWESIRGDPVFGIGIGELYRPPVPGMLDNLRWYIHNAYLWYWTYYGFIGLAALVVAVGFSVFRNFANWKKIRDPFLQPGLLALTFTLLTLTAASFYAPRFNEYATVPVVAVILGLSEAIIAAGRGKQQDAVPEENVGSSASR